MKRLPIAALALLAACVVPKPNPPAPPAVHRLQLYVHDSADRPLVSARVYLDNMPAMVAAPESVGPDAGWATTSDRVPSLGFNACGVLAGYTTTCAPVPFVQNLTITIALPAAPTPPVPPTPSGWTRAQLQDFQGDLMLWAPEVGCATDFLPIVCGASGIQAGYVWTPHVARYSPAKRATLYAKAKARGWTHFPVDVPSCQPGGGYHNLYPATADQCAQEDAATVAVIDELTAANLIPVCAGVGPDDPINPKIDTAKCPVAMNDWDNSNAAWQRIKLLSTTFPKSTLLYFELPGPGTGHPDPSGGDEPIVPTSSNGGQWLGAVERAIPNFVGVLYELDGTPNDPANAAYLTAANAWWRDVQQVNLESDTYWKFWKAYGVDQQTAWNDSIMKSFPFLQGCMSGCSTHAPPKPSGDTGHFLGELDLKTATGEHIAGDFASWPVTTHVVRVAIGPDDRTRVTLDNGRPDAWPDSHRPDFGPILWSMGLALKVADGSWHYSAPIQVWRGLDGSGGNISTPGQISNNWFYDTGRWGPLASVTPKAGDTVALFVCAGDCRDGNGDSDHSPVHERSNAVLFTLPAAPGGIIEK